MYNLGLGKQLFSFILSAFKKWNWRGIYHIDRTDMPPSTQHQRSAFPELWKLQSRGKSVFKETFVREIYDWPRWQFPNSNSSTY